MSNYWRYFWAMLDFLIEKIGSDKKNKCETFSTLKSVGNGQVTEENSSGSRTSMNLLLLNFSWELFRNLLLLFSVQFFFVFFPLRHLVTSVQCFLFCLFQSLKKFAFFVASNFKLNFCEVRREKLTYSCKKKKSGRKLELLNSPVSFFLHFSSSIMEEVNSFLCSTIITRVWR